MCGIFDGLKKICFVSVLLRSLNAAALSLVPVGEFGRPLNPATGRVDGPSGLSGITWVSGDTWYAVDDAAGGVLYRLTIPVDKETGRIRSLTIDPGVKLNGRDDLEGVAWDARTGKVWVSDERDGSIRAFDPLTGLEAMNVEVPPVFKAFRFNRSFESLTLHSNGLEMWTANEEALCSREAVLRNRVKMPPVDDGPRATRTNGSCVRLQKFTRPAPGCAWRPAGQWAYETDTLGGDDFIGKARSGVSDLCCLDDGTLLVLEREMSVKNKVFPSFRCRVYKVDFTDADDVSAVRILNGSTHRRVRKERLFGRNTGFAMYEGLSIGPRLTDGSRLMLMISDSDSGAAARVFSFKVF